MHHMHSQIKTLILIGYSSPTTLRLYLLLKYVFFDLRSAAIVHTVREVTRTLQN